MEWLAQTFKDHAEDNHARACNERLSERTLHASNFKLFAVSALTTDLSVGFRYTRPPPLAGDKPVCIDGALSATPQAILADHASSLQQVWLTGTSPNVHFGDLSRIPLLPRIQTDTIISASKSFKRRTTAIDGWHPRHYSLLDDNALDALASLFVLCEASGRFPTGVSDLQVTLISQDTDGTYAKRRGIGLFRSFVRLYGRIRRQEVSCWEHGHCSEPFYNNSHGRQVQDITWRSASRASLATAQGGHVAEMQADLRKCFEYVDRQLLWEAGQSAGYPLAILRLSIETYAFPRYVTLDQFAASCQPLVASRGIVPGGAFATSELKLLFRNGLRSITPHLGDCRLCVMVDDFIFSSISTTSSSAFIALHNAVARVISFLEHTMHMVFAPEKMIVVANSLSLAQRCLRSFGPYADHIASTINRMGVPMTAGKPHIRLLGQTARVRRALRRVPRISRLAKASGRSGSRLFFGGANLAANYGQEIIGMHFSLAKRLASAAVQTMNYPRFMGNNHIAWHLLSSMEAQVKHPLISSVVAPASRLCREWWLSTSPNAPSDTLTPQELVQCFHSEMRKIIDDDILASRWSRVASSPVLLAIRAFGQAGYDFEDPVSFACVEGGFSYDMFSMSPAALSKHLYSRIALRFVSQKVHDVCAEDFSQDALDIKQFGLCFEPAIKLLRSRSSTSLSVSEKRMLVQFFSGAVVTGSTLVKRGYNTNGLCPYCNCLDTTFHRVFQCSHFNDLRSNLLNASLIQLALRSGPTSLLFKYGWSPCPSRFITNLPPYELCIHYSLNGSSVQHCMLDPSMTTYVDGSAFDGTSAVLSRAGAAIAQFHSDMSPHVVMRIPVPRGLPQSAAFAERLAIRIANSHMPANDCARIVADCTGALLLLSDNAAQCSESNLNASEARIIRQHGIRFTHPVWLRAHQDRSQVPDHLLVDVDCNAAVDIYAKEAAAMHAVHHSDRTVFDADCLAVRRVLIASARMLACWPSNRQLYGELTPSRQAVPAPAGKPKNQHHFEWQDSCWVCSLCLLRKFTPASKLDHKQCGEIPQAILNAVNNPQGHVLHISFGSTSHKPVLFCSRCACYGTYKLQKLGAPCAGSRTAVPKAVRFGFMAHPPIHPVSKAPLTRPYRVRPFTGVSVPIPCSAQPAACSSPSLDIPALVPVPAASVAAADLPCAADEDDTPLTSLCVASTVRASVAHLDQPENFDVTEDDLDFSCDMALAAFS